MLLFQGLLLLLIVFISLWIPVSAGLAAVTQNEVKDGETLSNTNFVVVVLQCPTNVYVIIYMELPDLMKSTRECR